jgi:hypothetical protein
MRSYDATGIDVGGYPLIPEGWWPFRITSAKEGESKAGNYQVTVDAVCMDSRHKDMSVRHWVTFFNKNPDGTAPKGAGMALHFLSCIGEPHEGKFDINPSRWINKPFMAKATIEVYQGKRNNKLAEISPIESGLPSTTKNDEDAPF